MDKDAVLKNIFKLDQEDILDIEKVIHGYRSTINKCNNDTLLLRCLFAKGYHSTKEFYETIEITKDNSLSTTIFGKTDNLKSFLKLKELLDIDDNLFLEILRGINNEI